MGYSLSDRLVEADPLRSKCLAIEHHIARVCHGAEQPCLGCSMRNRHQPTTHGLCNLEAAAHGARCTLLHCTQAANTHAAYLHGCQANPPRCTKHEHALAAADASALYKGEVCGAKGYWHACNRVQWDAVCMDDAVCMAMERGAVSEAQ